MRYIRFPELEEKFGIPYSRMHLSRLEKDGAFPCRVRLSANCIAWLEAEVIAWCAARNNGRPDKSATTALEVA